MFAARAGLCSAAVALFALAPAGAARAQADDLQEQVHRALDRARPALLEHLRTATRRDAGGPGLLALLCLAALHDGVPVTDADLDKALRQLGEAEIHETYALALRLMVMEAHATFPDRARRAEADARVLLRCQRGGLFAYTPNGGDGDLSNTQYGALGLRAAASMGVDIKARVWTELLAAVMEMQDYDGGFGYRPEGRRNAAYPSMTAAGIAVLEIARQALEQDNRSVAKVKTQLKKAWNWMDKHVGALGNAETRSCYYFHYGLERAAILSDVTEVGGGDWYRLGARMMVRDQLGGGGWNSANDLTRGMRLGDRGDPVVTAFAVLFLRRAFRKVAGPITGPRAPALPQLDEQATAADVAACAAHLVSRGVAVLPEVLKALWSDVRPRRQAAARALRGIAGDDFGYVAEREPDQNRDAIRRAELWYLKNRPSGGEDK